MRQTPRAAALCVIPAKNEEATIAGVIEAILRQGLDVVVVDDDSDDATAALARRAGARVLTLVNNLGAWGATQTGLRYAVQQGYRYAITMDADGQHPPEAIADVMAPVQRGEADVAIGSCIGRGSSLRKLAWFLFRLTGGLAVSDLTSGFRCYNRAAIELLGGPEATLIDYQDIGVLFLLLEEGLRVSEVEIAMCARVSGHSRIFDTWLAVGEYMLLSVVLSVSKNLYKKKMGLSGR